MKSYEANCKLFSQEHQSLLYDPTQRKILGSYLLLVIRQFWLRGFLPSRQNQNPHVCRKDAYYDIQDIQLDLQLQDYPIHTKILLT